MKKHTIEKFVSYSPKTGKFLHVSKRIGSRGVGKEAGGLMPKGYRTVCINQKHFYAHRLAWFLHYGKWPAGPLDHVNGNRDDNRIVNLRLATCSQNNVWSKLHKNNTSGFRGVFFNESGNSWYARLGIGGKYKSLGCFKCPREAALVYDVAAIKQYGEFAKTNKILGLL